MSKIADTKLSSVSFHNNLVARYYINNSWCQAVANTAHIAGWKTFIYFLCLITPEARSLYSRRQLLAPVNTWSLGCNSACGPMLSVVEAASGWRPSQHVCPVESTPHSPRESKQQALASSACLFVSTRCVFCMRQARRGHNAHQEHPSGTTTLNASRTIVDTIATLD